MKLPDLFKAEEMQRIESQSKSIRSKDADLGKMKGEIIRLKKERTATQLRTANRQFNAAQHTRLTADWISSPTSADAELQGNIATIRERARDLERNETYVEKFLFELENKNFST